MIIKILSILFLVAVINGAPSFPADCPERLQTMDKYMKLSLLVTNPDQVLYQSEQELEEEFCKPAKNEYIKKIGEYKPCLRPFPKQLFTMAISTAKKHLKSVCSTTKQRNELVNNLKCFNQETLPELLQITYDLTSIVHYLANITFIDDIIPALCCGYQVTLPEIKEKVENLCSQNGVGESGSNYFIGQIKSGISEGLDMVCGNYESIEQCNQKVPNIVKEFMISKEESKNRQYNYTGIVPFLRVIDRIDTETNIN